MRRFSSYRSKVEVSSTGQDPSLFGEKNHGLRNWQKPRFVECRLSVGQNGSFALFSTPAVQSLAHDPNLYENRSYETSNHHDQFLGASSLCQRALYFTSSRKLSLLQNRAWFLQSKCSVVQRRFLSKGNSHSPICLFFCIGTSLGLAVNCE